MCDKKFWSFLSTLANFWKFSVTEASSALLHFSYFFWIDYFRLTDFGKVEFWPT